LLIYQQLICFLVLGCKNKQKTNSCFWHSRSIVWKL